MHETNYVHTNAFGDTVHVSYTQGIDDHHYMDVTT